MDDERAHSPSKWKERIQKSLGLKLLAILCVFSALYWICYLAISSSATYVRHASFWGQSRGVYVRIGSLHFSTTGYEKFMGIVFHPLLLSLSAISLVGLALILIMLLFLGIWGHMAAERARRESKEDLAAERSRQIKIKEIEAESKKINFVNGSFVGKCPYCGSPVNSATGKCTECAGSLS